MTREDLNNTIYAIVDSEVKPMTYQSYLDEYAQEETTGPRGITAKLFIKEVKVEVEVENEGDDDPEVEMVDQYQLREWIGNGSSTIIVDTFDTEEDAELELYAKLEYQLNTDCKNRPLFYNTEEEAQQNLSEQRFEGEWPKGEMFDGVEFIDEPDADALFEAHYSDNDECFEFSLIKSIEDYNDKHGTNYKSLQHLADAGLDYIWTGAEIVQSAHDAGIEKAGKVHIKIV